ncbi:hypothetical protein JNJ66_00305 [Candidatus Saccharibacteria bacterium]|nr:hypothetical protein [Candidatus Saccharibacteria bacterium]
MILISMVRWWYSEGLYGQIGRVARMLSATSDYFSIVLLMRTLFAPFKQISATNVSGPLGVRWRAWLDKLVSRLVGAVIRTITMFSGLITLAVAAVAGLGLIVGWVVLPLMPIIGLIASIVWRA